MITVRTKKELKEAINTGHSLITVEGELANKLEKANKIKEKIPGLKSKYGDKEPSKAMLIGTLGGIEIAVILAVIFLGLGLLVHLTKDYDLEVEVKSVPPKVKLHKRKPS
jgi:hypothetical protein